MPDFSFETLLEQWPGLTPEERLHAFQSLPLPERSEEFFLELNSRKQSDLLQDLPDGINRLWIRQLAPDAAADLIQFASTQRWPHLLGLLDETSRREAHGHFAAVGAVETRGQPFESLDHNFLYLFGTRCQLNRSPPLSLSNRQRPDSARLRKLVEGLSNFSNPIKQIRHL